MSENKIKINRFIKYSFTLNHSFMKTSIKKIFFSERIFLGLFTLIFGTLFWLLIYDDVIKDFLESDDYWEKFLLMVLSIVLLLILKKTIEFASTKNIHIIFYALHLLITITIGFAFLYFAFTTVIFPFVGPYGIAFGFGLIIYSLVSVFSNKK